MNAVTDMILNVSEHSDIVFQFMNVDSACLYISACVLGTCVLVGALFNSLIVIHVHV